MTNGTYLGAGTATTKILWHLDGNSNDSSGNANNGTDTAMSYALANGKFGQGALGNGTTSKAVKATNIGIAGTDALTVSMWFKLTGEIGSGAYCFWSIYSTLTADRYIQMLYEYNAGSRRLRVLASGTNLYYTVALGSTNWYNMILTRASGSGGNVALYLNSANVIAPSAGGTTGAALNSFNLFNDTSTTWFPGSADEVIVENTAWSAQKIQKYYTFAKGRFGII
jgi:hypothetical protein